MSRAVAAAIFYFLLMFGAGMFFGTLRELFAVRLIGPTASRLVEIPLMLAFSFFAAEIAARRLQVPAERAARLAMGLLAFLLLQVAEFALGLAAFRMGAADYAAHLLTPIGLVSLAAQVCVIFFPLLVMASDSDD